MNEFDSEMSRALSEFFARLCLEHNPEFARRMPWMGIQCHDIPMNPSHTCEWYEKRLGLNKENGNERD